VVFGFLSVSPLQAQDSAPTGETRIALVIGNGDYANVPLKNPANDATDMAAALKTIGSSVTLVVDGDFAAMNRAVRDFGNSIKRQDAVALFYYSGHGVQYQGANYLIPAHADIQSADELPYSAVNAEQVYAKMEASGARTNLIILDACRNNPFPGAERALERGLAVVGNVQPPRSLIVYSTAPGKTALDGEGRNGVFTTALLKHLSDPGLDAELMVRRVREDVIAATNGAQVPWHNSSITGQGFFFAGRGEIDVTTDPVGAEISVNGAIRGLSPLHLADIPQYGEVEIAARIGNRVASRRVTLRDVGSMTLELKLAAEKGGLAIKANEQNCKVLLDGAAITVSQSGVLDGLDAGTHLLELQGNSSTYRGQVAVVGGKTTTVEVALVPFGSLVLNLPAGTSCKIDGMGISDTTMRRDYGQLPAGAYTLAIFGGDYDAYTEKISVIRGQAYQFAPRLRFTAAYLTAKYSTELDSLALAEKRSVVDQIDIDQVAAFKRRVQDENRTELQPVVKQADDLQVRLVSLMARQAAAAAAVVQPSTGGTTMAASGPKELFTAYSSEYQGFVALQKSTTFKQEDIDRLADFRLKALAQPYQDFQDLAAQANALKDTLTKKLAENTVLAQRKLAYDTVVAKRDAAKKSYDTAVTTNKTASIIGWSGLGLATAAGVTSGVLFALAMSANQTALAATTMKDATLLGEPVTALGNASLYTGIGASIASGLGVLFLALKPNTKPLKDAVDHLDKEIDNWEALSENAQSRLLDSHGRPLSSCPFDVRIADAGPAGRTLVSHGKRPACRRNKRPGRIRRWPRGRRVVQCAGRDRLRRHEPLCHRPVQQ
jgi:hypothetical protein